MFSLIARGLLRRGFIKPLNGFSRAAQSTLNKKPVGAKPTLKSLMQEYGYSAVGVYVGIGLIDLPLCYLLVSFAGEEKIAEYEEKVKRFFGFGKDKSDDANDGPSERHSSFLATFAIAYGIHKSLIFIRLPIAAAITPSVVSKLRQMGFNIGNKQIKTLASTAKDSYKEHGLRKSVSSKGVKQIMEKSKATGEQGIVNAENAIANELKPKPNFGTPPTKRQKWWSWFF